MHCNRSCYRYAIVDDAILIWHHGTQSVSVLYDGTDDDFMDAWETADCIMQGTGVQCRRPE